MGYFLSNTAIGPTKSCAETVEKPRESPSAGEVRSFFGLMNFKAGSQDDEVSGIEQQAAFDTMKKSLAHAKKLAYFDRNSEETKLISDVQ